MYLKLAFKIKELLMVYGHHSPGLWHMKNCGLAHLKAFNLISGEQKTFLMDDIDLKSI